MASADSKETEPRSLPSRLPRGLHGVKLNCVKTDVGSLWMPAKDDVMYNWMRTMASWEPDVSAVIRDGVKGIRCFIDVGANIGYFSRLVALANPACHIEAFEPHPTSYSLLALNVWEFSPRVRCWPLALDDQNRTVGMRTDPNNLGDTHLQDSQDSEAVDLVVAAAPLDSLCPELSADFVKIDVQGSELSCIRGMAGVIRRSPAIKILIEFWPARLYETRQDPAAILEAYRSLGLKIRLLRGDAMMAASDQEILEYCAVSGPAAQANLLLTKR